MDCYITVYKTKEYADRSISLFRKGKVSFFGGSITAKERETALNDFNSGKTKLLVIYQTSVLSGIRITPKGNLMVNVEQGIQKELRSKIYNKLQNL